MADTKNYGIAGVGANIELGKRGNTIESNNVSAIAFDADVKNNMEIAQTEIHILLFS